MSLSAIAKQDDPALNVDDAYEAYISTDWYKNTVYKEGKADSDAPTLPLKDYPIGSYFTKSGKPCTCHGKYCDYNNPHNPKCNCLNFDNSIQCMGFANFVFYEYTGQRCVASNSIGELENLTPAALKSYLIKAGRGAHIRYTRKAGYAHSFILLSTMSDTVKIYEANWDNACGVGVRTLSYEELFNDMASIKNGWAAK